MDLPQPRLLFLVKNKNMSKKTQIYLPQRDFSAKITKTKTISQNKMPAKSFKSSIFGDYTLMTNSISWPTIFRKCICSEAEFSKHHITRSFSYFRIWDN